MAEGIALDEALTLATRLADALAKVHASGRIHLALQPSNIAIDAGGSLTITHFEHSVAHGGIPAPGLSIDRELSYVAPEETGRTNRLVDERSDLYSAGAIFYELFAKRPPFVADDALEIVHAHLTRVPMSPSIIRPGVPPVVSGIVLRLLAKTPEDRYQTAAALTADLREAQRRGLLGGAIEPFELGSLDLALQLPLPDRLYGRERELRDLEEAVDRALSGACEIVLVAGDGGVGKSALVLAIEEKVKQRRGLFATGKFDLRAANVPHASLREALGALARQILAMPDDARAKLRKRILEGTAGKGRALLDLVPELSDLIGEEPPLPAVDPIDAQTRLHLTLQAFVQAVAAEVGVIALFVDDLQWADAATIDALRALAYDPEARGLLLIGAYRPRELAMHDAANRLVDTLLHSTARVLAINLTPLDKKAVTELVSDALRSPRERVEPLAALLTHKTAGNPFFLRQLLRSLQKRALLEVEPGTFLFRWDLGEIERVGITDNVVELLLYAIRRLPCRAQELLGIAACIGKRVELGLLSKVADAPKEEVSSLLQPAVLDGLLIAEVSSSDPKSLNYRFVHDRVQHAAYTTMSEEKQAATHVAIARALEALGRGGGDAVFDVADQYNLGRRELTSSSERLELARLNRRAAGIAKASAAYGPALAYLRTAIDALPAELSEESDGLALALRREAAECAYVVGDYALSDELVLWALSHAGSLPQRASIHTFRIITETARSSWRDALRHGWEALAELGVQVEEISPPSGDARSPRSLPPAEAFLEMPAAKEAPDEAVLRLLVNLQHPAWFQDRTLFQELTSKSLRFATEHGVVPELPTALIDQAVCLCAEDRFGEAEAFAKSAVALADRLGQKGQLAHTTLLQAGFVRPWRSPISSVLPELERGISIAAEAGEMRSAAYGKSILATARFAKGDDLDDVLRDIDADMTFLQKTRNEGMIAFHACFRQSIRCLKGLTRERGCFGDAAFADHEFAEAAQAVPPLLALYHTRRLHVAYVFRMFPDAMAAKEVASRVSEFMGGYIPFVAYTLYSALTLAALADSAPADQRRKWIAEIETHEARLATWAKSCPDNFAHLSKLVAGERERLEGSEVAAADLYEQAMEGALRNGFVHHEALASELAARYARSRGRDGVADLYFTRARERYARWGACEKVKALDEERIDARRSQTVTLSWTAHGVDLDLEGLLRAAEAVSTEVELPKLLERLIEVCVQVAGATRAVLVLEEDGQPFVRASGGASPPARIERTRLVDARDVTRTAIDLVRATRQPLALDDAPHDPRMSADLYVKTAHPKSILIVPVQHQAVLVATLYFENDLMTYAFPPARIRIVELLSAEIAISLENSLLFEKLRREVAERTRAETSVRFLANAGAELSESLDEKETIDRLAKLAVPTLGDFCLIDLVDEKRTVRRSGGRHADPAKADAFAVLLSQVPDSSSNEPASVVLRTNAPLCVPEVKPELLPGFARDSDNLRAVESLGPKSVIAVPMIAHGRTLGILTCASARPDRRFGPRDVTIAEELARRAALALDNARLFRRAQDAVQIREDFLSVAAHELNTPMTSLMLAVQGLVRGKVPDTKEAIEQTLGVADRQLQKLARQIDELLDVTRISGRGLVLTLEAVDLAAVTRDVVDRLGPQAGRANTLISIRAPDPVIGSWDRARLDQVVTNLVTNAIKFGASNPIELAVSSAGRHGILTVSDHGIGIAPDRVAGIFERFERAVSVRQYGGLGLGLYIVKSIVEAFGGTVRVETTLGSGSTFTVELPL